MSEFNVLLHQGYTLIKSADLPVEVIAAAYAATDFNGDGKTDFVDFFRFVDAFDSQAQALFGLSIDPLLPAGIFDGLTRPASYRRRRSSRY